jgi:hypothetical protein
MPSIIKAAMYNLLYLGIIIMGDSPHVVTSTSPAMSDSHNNSNGIIGLPIKIRIL